MWSHGVNGPECAKHVRNLDVNDVRIEMYFEVFTAANAALNKQHRTYLTFGWPCIVIYSCNQTNEMH